MLKNKHGITLRIMVVLWIMMGCQMLVWAWFSSRGGQTTNHQFLIFSLGLMIGQIGTSIECLLKKAWGTMVMQLYFFLFTAFGLFQRLH